MLRRMAERLLFSAAATLDETVAAAVEARSQSSGGPRVARSHPTTMAFLESIARQYPAEPSRDLFPPPAPIVPIERPLRERSEARVTDLCWPSGYRPFLSAYADRFLASPANREARARLFLRGSPRPVAILVHGYFAGHLGVEEWFWPLSGLDAIGLDAALFVMPFHGKRAEQGRTIPEFPSADPRKTIEGFRQAVHDLRGLIAWLRAQGHPRVGLMGMSLGGYLAALTATIEADLQFLVPVIPLACLADFALERGTLSADPEQARMEHAALERLYRLVSPLSLPSLVAPERVLLVGARADRITPIAHARRLAAHFGAPIQAWRGGHLLQLGRRRGFERVLEAVEGWIRN